MFARTGLLLRAEFKRMCVLGQNQITRLNKTMSLVLLIVCRFFLQHFSQLKGVVRRDFVSVCIGYTSAYPASLRGIYSYKKPVTLFHPQ